MIIELRLRCETDQPEPFVAAIAAAGVRGILDGVVDDVVVTHMTKVEVSN